MEKRKIYKILKRVLPILCSILVLATALITPISAVVNVSHREEQGNYDLTERSTFPLTVGLAFDIGDTTSIFTTSVGGFGQQNNASSGGSDSFDWLTTESSSGTYLDGQLNYQLLDRQTYSKQFYNASSGKASNGYGTASIQPIKISVDGSTDLTQGKDCSSVVYKLQDVVINSSLIRKGNYVDNVHLDQIVAGKNEKDEFYSPSSTDYRYLVPHVVLPEISATAGYLGRYNVKATIVDQWGVSWELDYSVPIDTRGADTDTYIPFLPMSIFDSYGKEKGDRDYNIGMSNTVLLSDYQSYLDLDYYEYKNVIPDINLIVNLRAEVGGEDTIVKQEFLPLGEYVGQTFTEWIASVDGQDGYTFSHGVGAITMTYTDTENDFVYSGAITDGNGANVYGASVILDQEYRANLYREEEATTDELAGTWLFNDVIDVGPSITFNFDFYLYGGANTLYDGMYTTGTYLRYGYVNSTGSLVAYNGSNNTWFDDVFKSVVITSNLSEVTNGSTLLTWLKANATKQNTASTVSVVEEPTSVSTDTPITTSTAEWVKVEGTEYGRSAVFTLPFYALTDVSENMVDSDVYSYPTFQKYIKAVQKTGGVPTPQIDYTSWLATATSGFLNAELMPNFSIGGVLAILIGFSIVMLFLKFFAGG